MRLFYGPSGGITERCYSTLLGQAKGAASVLEFGPGCSTFAFIEAGARCIVTCEHDAHWLTKAKGRFENYPHVTVLPYRNEPTVAVVGMGDWHFDLAFVDSPPGNRHRIEQPGQEGKSRLNTVLYALDRADVVLLHDAHRPGERASLMWLQAQDYGIEILPGRGNIARITHAD